MVQLLVYAREQLDAAFPGLSSAAVGALAVLAIWLLKRFAPAVFAKLPPALQAMPAMVFSAVVSSLAAAEPTLASILQNALGGAFVAGTFAVGAHHVLKESPLPYGDPPKPSTPAPPVHITIVIVALLVVQMTVVSATIGFMLFSCTPQQRQALALPVVTQADAIAMTISKAVDWAADHGVNPETIQDARHVIETRDLPTAVELAKRLLQASADAGEQVPPELVALIQTAEGALAAQGIQDGMRALKPEATP